MTTATPPALTCHCGSPADPDLAELRAWLPSLDIALCTACYEASRREEEAGHARTLEQAENRRRLALLDAVATVAGAKVFATDLGYPGFNAALWVAVQPWTVSTGRWIVIHGPPGACKTRVAALLARKIILDRGERLEWMTAGTFQETVETLNACGRGDTRTRTDALARLRDWKTAPWLVIDDIGKNTWFPTLEAKFFELIDHRETHFLPTIITSNRPLSALVQDISPDRATPIVSRIIAAAAGHIYHAAPPR